jgi:hypothetical protein
LIKFCARNFDAGPAFTNGPHNHAREKHDEAQVSDAAVRRADCNSVRKVRYGILRIAYWMKRLCEA